MAKLTQDQVIWILDSMEHGRLPVTAIARRVGVTPQWVRALWRRSNQGEFVPILQSPGRPKKEVSQQTKNLVLEAFREYRLDPQGLAIKIRQVHNMDIPKNRIWGILKDYQLVEDTPAKQKRRKWVRFEREHSNSMWQTDFTQIGERWMVAFLDDASRFITGWTEARRATAELAWDTFVEAGESYGFPRQLLTDHGTQFTKIQYGAEGYIDRELRRLELREGIKVEHILGRRNHPQTCGKIERVFGTLKAKLRADWPEGGLQFPGGLEEIVPWYNEVKPHRSLNFKEGETPAEAFIRKMRTEELQAWLRRILKS